MSGGGQYILAVDETNKEPSKSVRFFIYGGCVVPVAAAHDLCSKITNIRQECGMPRGAALKFNTASRPADMEPSAHKEVKRGTLEAARDHDVKLTAVIVHHQIAGTKTERERLEWSLKPVAGNFEKFLDRVGASGQIIADRDENAMRLFRQIMEKGVDPVWFGGDQRRTIHLSRVWQFSEAAIGTGHIMSVVDVALGSLRYCVNDPDAEASRAMFPVLHPMLLWGVTCPDNMYAFGLQFYPKEVRIPCYREDYKELRHKLEALVGSGADDADRSAAGSTGSPCADEDMSDIDVDTLPF